MFSWVGGLPRFCGHCRSLTREVDGGFYAVSDKIRGAARKVSGENDEAIVNGRYMWLDPLIIDRTLRACMRDQCGWSWRTCVHAQHPVENFQFDWPAIISNGPLTAPNHKHMSSQQFEFYYCCCCGPQFSIMSPPVKVGRSPSINVCQYSQSFGVISGIAISYPKSILFHCSVAMS